MKEKGFISAKNRFIKILNNIFELQYIVQHVLYVEILTSTGNDQLRHLKHFFSTSGTKNRVLEFYTAKKATSSYLKKTPHSCVAFNDTN